MIGKSVMEDKGQNRPFKQVYHLSEAEVKLDAIMIRQDFKTGSDQTMHIEDGQDMDKIIEAAQDMILIIEVVMGIIQEVIKGMGDLIITVIEGEVIEVKITTGIGVDHMKDRRDSRSVSNSRSRSGSRASTNKD